jgi:UDP-galactopyranose mutase
MFGDKEYCDVSQPEENLFVVVPYLKSNGNEQENISRRKSLLSTMFSEKNITDYFFWYYTPMSLYISDHFNPKLVIYDCMDELSAFKFAPAGLKESESELFNVADLVFTGGYSLYEAKKHRHHQIFPFPSSIDKQHFQQARTLTNDPQDQASIAHPRFGFYGVIDERMNIDLIGEVAQQKPDWHFVIIGPVVKIDKASLPQHKNIHYLGNKSYQELPSYLAGWDVAMIPFALNESTRFISPTKTPEYLSAGKPVISSSIQDVINPYGINKLVHIADTPEEFIAAGESELNTSDRSSWLSQVDSFLQENSWDNTWNQMVQLIEDKLDDEVQDNKFFNLNLKRNIYV